MDAFSGMFGGGPDEPAAPPPDYAQLWRNYSQWTTEARERYESDLSRLRTMPGMVPQAREQAIAERETEFQREMQGLESGPAKQLLRDDPVHPVVFRQEDPFSRPSGRFRTGRT